MKDFFLTQALYILGLKKTEDKLRIYNGYINYTLFDWILKNKISPALGYKILKKLKIYSAREMRNLFRETVIANKDLFDHPNTYFTSFGSPDIIFKSGNRLISDFRNSNREYENRIIPIWKIPSLPKDSNIIFFDDLVGTGRQSTDYIKEISALLNSSHKPFLFCICGTSEGLNLIATTTSFKVFASDTLQKKHDYFTHGDCHYFNIAEKNEINIKTDILKSRTANYNLGLLIAFEHSAPNNTIPLIWKDGFNYKQNLKERKWIALLPREY